MGLFEHLNEWLRASRGHPASPKPSREQQRPRRSLLDDLQSLAAIAANTGIAVAHRHPAFSVGLPNTGCKPRQSKDRAISLT